MIVHALRDVRKQRRDLPAALAVLLELPGTRQQRRVAFGELADDGAVAGRQRLAVVFFERGFGVESVHLAGPADHEQEDDGFRLGREMRRLGGQRIHALCCSRGRRVKQRSQRDGAESVSRADQNVAARYRRPEMMLDQGTYTNSLRFNSARQKSGSVPPACEELFGQPRLLGGAAARERRAARPWKSGKSRACRSTLQSCGEGLRKFLHEAAVEQRKRLQRMRANRTYGAGRNGIGLVEGGQQRQPDAALVIEIDAAPVLRRAVGAQGPQSIALCFGEDQVVHFRLDGNAHRPAADFRIQRAGYRQRWRREWFRLRCVCGSCASTAGSADRFGFAGSGADVAGTRWT